MILIDDGQTLKKLLNHAYSAGLAWGCSELWSWLILGGVWRGLAGSLDTLFGTN